MPISDKKTQSSVNYHQLVATQLVTAIVILDHKLAIQYLNPAGEALLMRSLNKLYNKSFNDLLISSSINQQRLEQVLATGQEFTDSDVTLTFNEQRVVSAEITASFVEFQRIPHILIEFKKIDQQKQISLEIFQQQQWESARDLIRGLAHEIKNPLGGLRGAAQLLNNELNPEQQEYTAMIIEQADRLTKLVDRLLGPNQLPKMAQDNIHSVLEKVFKLVSFDNPKNIKLVRDYDPSIPDVTFDPDQIQQTLLNIVNNAIQANQPGNSIYLKTRVASNQTIKGKRIKLCAQVSIIDNGPGIPSHIQDTLFYPMVSGRLNGTGLGLSIAQTLVNQHQGKLTCQSHPGHTEFTILLPLSAEK
jgi:two-component system nitrogen regulation sensor histidine kinase GlnL